MHTNLAHSPVAPGGTKIALLVMDGLGGLPLEAGGKTELETALTPNLDALAARSVLGLTVPVAPGITPGSGPGHLALFGYDPVKHAIGRGALEALGADLDLGPEDVAARGNFCTVDEGGAITDRRAGRIPTELGQELAGLLRAIRLEGAELFVETVKEHRFAFVLRGPGLGEALSDSDPYTGGNRPLPVRALEAGSERAAALANEFIRRARRVLADRQPANMVLLRGFARMPRLAGFQELYGLRAAAIAVNGMYRGVARSAGMTVLDVPGTAPEDEFAALEQAWHQYDFFYLHIKRTDTAGEDGDFWRKVRAIEEVDGMLPRLTALRPDVVVVSGDHSSPAFMRSHSWHPVPTLLYSGLVCADGVAEFGERACARGGLGMLPATDIMPLALAHARRLAKYGA
ncbi:MAG TPA: 2,3-bisphosphoglycerate-independent phosphoglycerate mutase [Anaerolineae bacterium]|nr:2,3-bisphosphoglycerate-independent phosphoglycerate mutase [Anaerolineae bacterium]